MNSLCRYLGLSRRLKSDDPDMLRRDLDKIIASSVAASDRDSIALLLSQFLLLKLRLPDARERVVAALAAIAKRQPDRIADALRDVSTAGRSNATTETDERDDSICRTERGLLADALASVGNELPGSETAEGRAAVDMLVQIVSDGGVWARAAALDALIRARIVPGTQTVRSLADIPTILRALTDPATVVRRRAATALSSGRNVSVADHVPEVMAALRAALVDPDATVRRLAQMTIDSLDALDLLAEPPTSQQSAEQAVASGNAEVMIDAGPLIQEPILNLLPPRRVGPVDDATPALCQALSAIGNGDSLPPLLAAIHAWAGDAPVDDHSQESFSTQMVIVVHAFTKAVERLGPTAPDETLKSIAETPDAEYTLYDSGGHGSLRPGRVSLESARNAARAAMDERAAGG